MDYNQSDDDIHIKKAKKMHLQIKNLSPKLSELARHSKYVQANYNKWSDKDWCRKVFGESLVRLVQLTSQDSNFVGTMSLLAVSRYIFELSVWLNLFNKDVRFGLVYYQQLLNTQHLYYKDTIEQMKREIELLKEFDRLDDKYSDEAIHKMVLSKDTGPDIGIPLRNAMDTVDAAAAMRFSLFLDEAKTNGYGYQAHLVETQSIPFIEEIIARIEEKIAEFPKNVSAEIIGMLPKRWEWKRMSEQVGLVSEYNYIYTFASKLLHATPASITTNHQELRPEEIYIFLRYIHSKLHEIMVLEGKI